MKLSFQDREELSKASDEKPLFCFFAQSTNKCEVSYVLRAKVGESTACYVIVRDAEEEMKNELLAFIKKEKEEGSADLASDTNLDIQRLVEESKTECAKVKAGKRERKEKVSIVALLKMANTLIKSSKGEKPRYMVEGYVNGTPVVPAELWPNKLDRYYAVAKMAKQNKRATLREARSNYRRSVKEEFLSNTRAELLAVPDIGRELVDAMDGGAVTSKMIRERNMEEMKRKQQSLDESTVIKAKVDAHMEKVFEELANGKVEVVKNEVKTITPVLVTKREAITEQVKAVNKPALTIEEMEKELALKHAKRIEEENKLTEGVCKKLDAEDKLKVVFEKKIEVNSVAEIPEPIEDQEMEDAVLDNLKYSKVVKESEEIKQIFADKPDIRTLAQAAIKRAEYIRLSPAEQDNRQEQERLRLMNMFGPVDETKNKTPLPENAVNIKAETKTEEEIEREKRKKEAEERRKEAIRMILAEQEKVKKGGTADPAVMAFAEEAIRLIEGGEK
jgi:hypothetical protein